MAITVFAVLVPSSMAFGDLAGVTPVAGLYVALGAMVMYALFGTSKQVITGPEATTAILTATAVAPLAAGDPVRYAALAAHDRHPRRCDCTCLPGWRSWGSSPTSFPSPSWLAISLERR